MLQQTTDKVLMIRPVRFYFNEETAVNNAYQVDKKEAKDLVEKRAMDEFDALVEKMKSVGIHVEVIQDTDEPYTPDSIFPNNWFSTHEDKIVVIYPMFAENRRLERKKFFADLEDILNNREYVLLDLTANEKDGNFLEGTGAMVIDRTNKRAYCTLSPRAHVEPLIEFCKALDYKPVIFEAIQDFGNGKKVPIYHTNVMMGIGEKYAVVCLESIINPVEKERVFEELSIARKEIVDIAPSQVLKFAGNVLEVKNSEGKRYTMMSKSAYDVLTEDQRAIISKSSEILYSDITTIETYGGGSVRCMIAELY